MHFVSDPFIWFIIFLIVSGFAGRGRRGRRSGRNFRQGPPSRPSNFLNPGAPPPLYKPGDPGSLPIKPSAPNNFGYNTRPGNINQTEQNGQRSSNGQPAQNVPVHPDWAGSSPSFKVRSWPDPVKQSSKVIQSKPNVFSNPKSASSATKDVFVWGQTVAGWVYAGKLIVVRNLQEGEILQYADGKFGLDLEKKLCIEADSFEQARSIFEQSQPF